MKLGTNINHRQTILNLNLRRKKKVLNVIIIIIMVMIVSKRLGRTEISKKFPSIL